MRMSDNAADKNPPVRGNDILMALSSISYTTEFLTYRGDGDDDRLDARSIMYVR